MSTVVAPPVASSRQGSLWKSVGWAGYQRLLAIAGNHPRIRMNYDRGDVEIMSLQNRHDRPKKRAGFAIEGLTDVLEIPSFATGPATYRRQDIDRGLEAVESYYLVDEPSSLSDKYLDLQVDRPPDLVVEVDITSSTLDKLGIYAALGFPEIWQWEGGELQVLLLGLDGGYTVSARSSAFPWLPMAEVSRFVRDPHGDDTLWRREFRAFVLPLYQAWPGP